MFWGVALNLLVFAGLWIAGRFGWSNCMIHAISRWCHGGWLLIRGAHIKGWPRWTHPFFHFGHTPHLPPDLPIIQYLIDDESLPPWRIVFKGHFEYQVGHVKPYDTNGRLDLVNVSLVAWVIGATEFALFSIVKYAITIFAW